MIRLLLVCESFTGGCKRHISDILDALASEDFEVTLVYSDRREPGCEKDIPSHPHLETVRMDMLRRPAPLSDILSSLRLRRYMRRGKVDLIHLHSSKAGMVGRWAKRLAWGTGAPIVYSPHGLSFQVGGLRGLVFLAAEKLLARRTEHFLAVSEGEAETIRRTLAGKERIDLIPNAVNCSDYDIPLPERGPITVGMMGRLVEQKGAVYFIDAAMAVSEKLPGTRFVIAGDGPQRAMLERRAGPLGDKMTFLGECIVKDLLSKVSIVAIPSLWEGLPYFLLEAMAAGRAIAASRIPGIADTLGECGILVPPRDAAALAGALCRLSDDAEERQSLGTAARERAASEFSLDDFSKRMVGFYRRLTAPTISENG